MLDGGTSGVEGDTFEFLPVDDAMATASEADTPVSEAHELVETLLDVYDARLNSLSDRIEQVRVAKNVVFRAM